MEVAVNNARCKGRVEICHAASQEQGRPPAGCSRPMSPSADRGEEVGGLSTLRAELNFQPQLLPYIPDGAGGGGGG